MFNTTKQNIVWITVISGIIMAALSRFLPHPPNFTPIAALALFSGACISNKRIAFIMPLAGMLLSDLIFELIKPGYGFHITMPYVYGSFMLIILLGMLNKNLAPGKLMATSLAGSVLFFAITNFGTWLAYYPHTMAGFTQNYLLALPFFQNNIVGDLFFNLVLFGGMYFANSRISSTQKA